MLRLNKYIHQNRRINVWKWVVGVVLCILFVSAIFTTGYQFGRGAWQIHYGQSAIPSNKNLPNSIDCTSINEVYQTLKQKFDGPLDINKLMTGAKTGLVQAAGDPYTTYMDSSDAKQFNEELTGSFTGIGAELSKNGNNLIIVAPISGYPADKAGLKANDVITEINGQDTSSLSIDQAVDDIRGPEGSTVSLTILRDNTTKLTFKIVREVITIPSVNTKILSGNIGYIQITSFAQDTASLTDNAAKDFKDKSVKGIILDLRNDPGGYLDAAVSVSSEWLKSGQLVLQEKRGSTVIQSYSAQIDGQLVGIPTVVLINGGSASASEITAGALQDNKAAQVVGVVSFGKGSVQEVNNFPGGDLLKVTVAKWYTPDGKNIDKHGITPNFNIVLTDADAKAGNDTQLNYAEQLLNR